MKDKQKLYYLISLGFQLGFSLAIPLVVCIAGGVYLDKKFLTSPLFTLIGIILGLISSGYMLYKDLQPLFNNKKIKN